jgi:hypothetical protein
MGKSKLFARNGRGDQKNIVLVMWACDDAIS